MITKSKLSRGIAIFFMLLMALSFTASGCTNKEPSPTEDPGYKPIMQRFNQADVIYVVKPSTKGLTGKVMNASEKLLLQSLQGIVAQRQAELFLGSPTEKFIKHAKIEYKLTLDDGKNIYTANDAGEEEKKESNTTWLSNLKDIIQHYIETKDIQGYIRMRFKPDRYSQQESQVNQACTLAGINRWIIVPEDLEVTFVELFPDLEMKYDLVSTNLTEYDIIKENLDKLNKDMLILQAPPRTEHLREYGIASKAGFYFYNKNTPQEEKDFVYKNLNTLAHGFGWEQVDVKQDGVDYGFTEDPSVDFASSHDVNIIAADWCTNLSVWSSLPTGEFKQKESKKIATEDENVHYMTLLYSDGDNLQWMSGGSFANSYFESVKAEKKEMPFGWTATPNMVDTLPNMIKYLYDNMTENEHFVVPVSGYAYSHPARFSPQALQEFVKRTNDMMGQADMQYVAMKGVNKDVMNAFAQQENFKGGFIMYGKNEGRAGWIYWSNNKPFVHDRLIFWKDSGDWANPEYVAKNMTQLQYFSTDKTKASAYTFVQVHCWSYKYSDLLKTFWANLDKTKIKVVTPNEFMELIKKNIEPKTNNYTIPK